MNRRLRALHRTAGVIAGVGVIWLGLTGLLLQLAAPFGWDRAPLPAGLMRVLYPRVEASAAGAPLARLVAGGAAALRAELGPTELVLRDADDQPIERIALATIGLGMPAATLVEGARICVRDTAGAARCTTDGVDWQQPNGTAGSWTRVSLSPGTPRGDAQAPTWERLLQDLHAWRFAGPLAPALGVAVALALLALALTGLWTTLTRPAPR
jgi:hypothetical protein